MLDAVANGVEFVKNGIVRHGDNLVDAQSYQKGGGMPIVFLRGNYNIPGGDCPDFKAGALWDGGDLDAGAGGKDARKARA